MKKEYCKFFLVLTMCLLLCQISIAQVKSVVGYITDSMHRPVSDLTIRVKGKHSKPVFANEKGVFEIPNNDEKIKLGDTLVIEGVGFGTNLFRLTTFDTLHLTILEKVAGLNDVVVIGYGRQKKITMTGAVASISGDIVRQSPAANLQNALAGRLPGLFSEQRSGQPGNDAASIQIRGISSYTSSTSPLILVDDVQFTYSQLQQIDANEVESITILKDASTTAIYGVQGANGVILVTTRRGAAGRPQLSFRNEYGLQFPTRMPKQNDGYTTLSLLREYLLEQGIDPSIQYPQYFGGNNLNYYKDNSDPYGHPNVNWWNVLMRKMAPIYRTNFDISGGTEKVKYFISLGYITQGGIYNDFWKDQPYNGNYSYNRYNFRSNIDIAPTKTLKLRVDLSGRLSQTNIPNDKSWNGGGNTFQYLWDGELSSFAMPIYNPNGSYGANTNISTYKPNPVANLTYSGYDRTFDNNMSVVASAIQQLDFITPGLSVKGLLSYASDYNFYRNLTRSSSEIPTFYFNVADSSYTPATTNLYYLGNLSRSSGTNSTSSTLNTQLSLEYKKSFGVNNVSGLVLWNQTTNQSADADDGASIPTKFRGLTGRISYNFDQKYLFDFNAAYNGSDKFGSGKKYGFFPAVSVGWNMANEDFFSKIFPLFDMFKLRASYGIVGSDDIGSYDYAYTQEYETGKTYNFGQTSTNYTGLYEGTLGNPNVTWEKVKKWDIGADIQLLKGKLTITPDYFHDFRYDILTTRSTIPATLGVGLPPVNLGKVKNQGYELEIKYNGNVRKVSYWIDGQVSYAKNKIIYMDEPPKDYPWLAKTGNSIGAVFGYTWTGGFFQNVNDINAGPLPSSGVALTNMYPGALKLKDLTGDGILNENDMGYLGTNQPRYTAGLSFGIGYKGFDLSVLFNGAFDYIINIQRGALAYSSRMDRTSSPFNLGRWTPDNAANATYPSLAPSLTNQYTSSFWYRNGDYIRFKNFQLGYTLPQRMLKRLNLKSVRIYANGYNLGLLWTALPVQIDPESAASSSVGEYPQERIINFGIQIGL